MMNQFSYINDRTEETIRAILAKEQEEKEQQIIAFQYINSKTREAIKALSLRFAQEHKYLLDFLVLTLPNYLTSKPLRSEPRRKNQEVSLRGSKTQNRNRTQPKAGAGQRGKKREKRERARENDYSNMT